MRAKVDNQIATAVAGLGLLAGAIAVWQALAARHEARRDLALEEARALGRLKDHFLSSISHEMKTPLSLIKGYAELLEDKYPTEELVVGIQDGARRLEEHISNILDYSALVSGTLPLYLAMADPAELVANVRAGVEDSFRQAGLTFATTVPPDVPTLRCDERRVVQLLCELLDNARKFTPAGGHVQLRVESDGHVLRFVVSDGGHGIPLAAQERIWEAFSQLETGDASRRGGLGLGLAIVKLLVELHRGRVDVLSEPGRGCRFCVELPLAGPR
jgi:signal transduction histidine kinase